ncbi:MAG TPA: DinB family protein [Pseudonocardiaceae bacterium]
MAAMPKADVIRELPPYTGDESAQINSYLDWQRATVHLKSAGLSDADAHRSTIRSPLITVASLVSHLRWVERYWFSEVLGGIPHEAPYTKENPDGDFTVAADRPLAALLAEYADECDTSRLVVAKLDLDTEVPHKEYLLSVRWVVLHMIEETARHAGHLDIVRENLDGVVGE